MANKRWYLGDHKNYGVIYLEDFSWDCDWYWSGGYIGNKSVHTHFNTAFSTLLNKVSCNWFDGFKDAITNSPLTDDDLWRLCDLMQQFYAHKKSAECFKHGGNYSSKGLTKKEINLALYKRINKHIEKVIIPQVRKLMDNLSKK